MHLWQAIKMACKSLWTNKLRSFLTMLGIIIGVMTVALLTSVASGVQTAVISSIRTQSTLSIIMNSSETMTNIKLKNILTEEQPDKDAKDYYEYSMILSASGVISKSLDGVSDDEFKVDYGSYVFNEPLKYFTEEEMKKLKGEELTFAAMHNMRQKARPMQASVYAVDDNFDKVYKLEMDGKFPETANELLVDMNFVKSYIGENYTPKTAIGEEISLGIEYYNRITIKFKDSYTLTTEDAEKLCNYFEGLYKIGVNPETGDDIYVGAMLSIIPNADDSLYIYDDVTKTMIVNVEFIQRSLKNENYRDDLTQLNLEYEETIKLCPEVATNIDSADSVKVEDVFDKTNAKTYTISGVIKEGSSMFTGMGSGSSGPDEGLMASMMSLMTSHISGTCYMLLENSNLAPIGEDVTDVSNVVISYAYLRYKTEDVMSDSTTSLSLALMRAGYNYMTDFMVISMSSVASIVDNVMSILTTMLTVISIVSLIVGGIGIMNIMLVAVTERTREIGIRKAIGAKKGSILTQFLVEALMLSLVGGAIGLGISAIGCAIIGHFMGVAIGMPLWVIAMSIGFCTAIGLIFGMFPAIKASNMQPIDALRRE